MSTWRLAFAAVLGLATAGAAPVARAGGSGAALFDGGPEAASIEARVGPGGIAAPAPRFACRTCHGRDARGSLEGGATVPAIDPDALAVPALGRPPYDVASFLVALRDGVDPQGRQLAPLMPRYGVSGAEAAELLAHLSEMAVRERAGVDLDGVRVGIPDDLSSDLAAAFRRAWSDRGDPRLHGRRLLIEPVGPAGDAGVFAMLFAAWPPKGEDAAAGPARGTGQGAAFGAPTLFPVAPLQGGEDAGLVRGLFASRTDQMAALLGEAPADALLVADEGGRALFEGAVTPAGDARLAVSIEDPLPSAGSAMVVMAGPAGWRRLAARQWVAPGATLYGCLDDAVGAVAQLRRQGVRLVLADPRPARGGAGPDRPARERFAVAAAEVLEAALAAAGRDLTRGGLVRALSRLTVAPPGWPALDYGRVPLTGSRDVRLIRLDPTP